ncbi:nuclear transport factor 2 family protein [Vogesella sp. LIG4]|uniref:nuclear transport factor 2 family protein n=1 Tax=Vogesella sp. LIG4 TaxID=1192162 RepID=UPI00081FA6FE|nr:nuclear transport factor 2 family protein [Vogesella sp. LIG4]SCK19454.1 Predicted SnoaL-like aldol condensation-catalyzing enzyme [Vogesella sp. LIG4]
MTTPASPKQAAVAFLQLAAAGQVDEAFARFAAANFRHHNPGFAGDGATLQAAMRDNARQHPDKTFEVQRVIAEGELVAVHSRVHLPAMALTLAVVHIFRFEHGRIAELWDIGQPQPAAMPNQHGMF